MAKSLMMPAALMLTAAAVAASPLLPATDADRRDAETLAAAGPAGSMAYHMAMRDGRLTRGDVTDVREAAGRDIDREFGLVRDDAR